LWPGKYNIAIGFTPQTISVTVHVKEPKLGTVPLVKTALAKSF
jgi:hypothetical protein